MLLGTAIGPTLFGNEMAVGCGWGEVYCHGLAVMSIERVVARGESEAEGRTGLGLLTIV